MSNPNVVVSPNMSLPIPDLADPGPDYATNVNDALGIIDGHQHTGSPTDGLQIDLSKQTTTGDIELDGNNLGTVRSLEMVSQSGALTGTQDVNCLYVNAGTLGFNDSSGVFHPLTSATVPANFTNFSAITVTSNHTILATDVINFVGCDSTGGAIAITLPRAATIQPVPQWRMYLIKDLTGAADTHAITIQVTGGSGDTFALVGSTSVTIQTRLGYIGVVTDGVSLWYVWDQTTYNGAEVLNVNGGTIVWTGGGGQNGTCSFGAGGPYTAAGSRTITAADSYTTGTLAVDTQIGAASSSKSLCFVPLLLTIANTGTTTLTAAQMKAPIIEIAAVTLIADVIIAVPTPIAGAVYIVVTANIAYAGHNVQFSCGGFGAVTIPSSAKTSIVVCISNGHVFVLNSA